METSHPINCAYTEHALARTSDLPNKQPVGSVHLTTHQLCVKGHPSQRLQLLWSGSSLGGLIFESTSSACWRIHSRDIGTRLSFQVKGVAGWLEEFAKDYAPSPTRLHSYC